MLSRHSILKSIVIFFVLIWFVDAEAVIYKWKDDNGKTHFTDDPTKVPEAFREKPFLENSKNTNEEVKSGREKDQVEGNVVSEKNEDVEKEDGKQAGLTDAQRSTIEAVVNFLKEDIPRYDKIYTYPPSRSKFRALKLAVAGSTAQKKGILEQVNQHDLPLLDSVSEFLKASIVADEKSQKVLPTTIVSTRQTQTLMNRLKSEAGQEAQLLEKLTDALNAEKDS